MGPLVLTVGVVAVVGLISPSSARADQGCCEVHEQVRIFVCAAQDARDRRTWCEDRIVIDEQPLELRNFSGVLRRLLDARRPTAVQVISVLTEIPVPGAVKGCTIRSARGRSTFRVTDYAPIAYDLTTPPDEPPHIGGGRAASGEWIGHRSGEQFASFSMGASAVLPGRESTIRAVDDPPPAPAAGLSTAAQADETASEQADVQVSQQSPATPVTADASSVPQPQAQPSPEPIPEPIPEAKLEPEPEPEPLGASRPAATPTPAVAGIKNAVGTLSEIGFRAWPCQVLETCSHQHLAPRD